MIKPGREVYVIDASKIREVMKTLVDGYGGEVYLSTLAGVDRVNEKRIELNYFVHIIPLGRTIVIKTYVPRDNPRIDSVLDIIPGAYAGENETYDLLGVEFVGNKHLRRGFFVPKDVYSQNIYPLRKDAKV